MSFTQRLVRQEPDEHVGMTSQTLIGTRDLSEDEDPDLGFIDASSMGASQLPGQKPNPAPDPPQTPVPVEDEEMPQSEPDEDEGHRPGRT